MEKSELKRIGGEIQEALRKKDWPRGIEFLEKWCAHMPKDATGWYYRAYCYARMGKLIEAKACAERSASLNPGGEETKRLLSYLEKSLNKRIGQDVEKGISYPADRDAVRDTLPRKPEETAVEREEASEKQESRQPRIVYPQSERRELSFSPVSCNRVTAGEAGIVIHRKDAGEIPYDRVRLLSAFEEGRGIDRGVKLLLFVKGQTRPFVAEANQIQYKDFPSVQGESLVSSLRNFTVLLFHKNPGLLVDQPTWEFMEGKPPSLLAADIVVTATALARELEDAISEEPAVEPGEETSPDPEERPEATAAEPEQDRRTEPRSETAELAGKMLDEDEEALERIVPLQKSFKRAVKDYEDLRIKLLTSANPWFRDRGKALMREATQKVAEANAAFKLGYLGLFFVSRPGLEAPIAELKEAARGIRPGLSEAFFEELRRNGFPGDMAAEDPALQKILQVLVRAYKLEDRMVELKGKILSEDSGAEELKTPKPENSTEGAIPSHPPQPERRPLASGQPVSQLTGIVCPQCGARDQTGSECQGCGILFAKNQPFQILRRNGEKLKLAASGLKKPGRDGFDPRGAILFAAEEWGNMSRTLEKRTDDKGSGVSRDYIGALLLSHCMGIEKTLLSCGQYTPVFKGIVKETKRVVSSLIPDPHHHLTLAGFAFLVFTEANSLASVFSNPERPFPTDLVPVLDHIVKTLRSHGERLKDACAQAAADHYGAAQKGENGADVERAASSYVDPAALGREMAEFCEYHHDPILFEVMNASYPSKFNEIPGSLKMVRSIAELLIGLDVD